MVGRPEPDSVLPQAWETVQVAGAPDSQISQQELRAQQGELQRATGLAGLPSCCGFAPVRFTHWKNVEKEVMMRRALVELPQATI